MPEKWAIPVCGRPKFGHGQVVPATHKLTARPGTAGIRRIRDLHIGIWIEIADQDWKVLAIHADADDVATLELRDDLGYTRFHIAHLDSVADLA
jgi:hypothetical protein